MFGHGGCSIVVVVGGDGVVEVGVVVVVSLWKGMRGQYAMKCRRSSALMSSESI